jgi:hypothetical protein
MLRVSPGLSVCVSAHVCTSNVCVWVVSGQAQMAGSVHGSALRMRWAREVAEDMASSTALRRQCKRSHRRHAERAVPVHRGLFTRATSVGPAAATHVLARHARSRPAHALGGGGGAHQGVPLEPQHCVEQGALAHVGAANERHLRQLIRLRQLLNAARRCHLARRTSQRCHKKWSKRQQQSWRGGKIRAVLK